MIYISSYQFLPLQYVPIHKYLYIDLTIPQNWLNAQLIDGLPARK
jgi:hypothetical protein